MSDDLPEPPSEPLPPMSRIAEQHPRTEPPTLKAPVPPSRDVEDPLSVEALARRVPDLEAAIGAATRLRRICRRELGSEPGWPMIRGVLESHIDELVNVLTVAKLRPPSQANWIAWRAAWRLYVRAYEAIHRSPPPDVLAPPLEPST